MSNVGLFTGALGYTLKKETFNDALYYRETQVFDFDLYSLDLTLKRPSFIQQTLINEYNSRYSGDINVKVFEVPGSYTFPENGVQAAKFHAQIEVKGPPVGLSTVQPELSGNYYKGLSSAFWVSYSTGLLDFKEDFGFIQDENGNQSVNHSLSFALLSGMGGRTMAASIASGVFQNDKDTTMGVCAAVGAAKYQDSGAYRNYYTESYDTLRNVFSFNKRVEMLPLSGSQYSYSLNHSLDIDNEGIFSIGEKAHIKGFLNFPQAKAGADTLYAGAFGRCSGFYSTYKDFAGGMPVNLTLVSLPRNNVRVYNSLSLTADYDVSYTNSPLWKSNGSIIEEVISFDADEKNYVSIRDSYTFTTNKRNPSSDFSTLITSSISQSPAIVAAYYTSSNLNTAGLSAQLIKYDVSLPNHKTRATLSLEYSNNPRYFRSINGITFKYVDCKVTNTVPADMVSEYKIVNRPTKNSIINYAYQTEKGSLGVNLEAGIGRNPTEFINGFRTDVGTYLQALYKYGITTFLQQFNGTKPLSFTYFLSDARYNLTSEGVLQLDLTFVYTLKKYALKQGDNGAPWTNPVTEYF